MQNSQYNLDELLRELEIDPNDAQAKKSLEHILRMKPQVTLSNEFRSELKQKLHQEATLLRKRQDSHHTAHQNLSSNQPLTKINYFSITMKRFIMPAILAVFVFVAGGAWYANSNNPVLFGSNTANEILSGKLSVEELGENSFGDLSKVEIIANDPANGIGGQKNAQQGNEVTTAMADVEKIAAPGAGGSDAQIMPPMYPDAYKFNYTGGSLPNINDNQSIFKRVQPQQSPGLVSRVIKFFSFGLIDLSKFSNTKLQNLSFVEDKEYGYGVNVELSYGSVSLYQNWEKWPQPKYECYGYYCGQQPQLKKEDMPSDEKVIAATDRFISEYAISMEGYGKPRVVDYSNWILTYAKTEDKANFYFPEAVNVVYPILLEGKESYDESGNVTGLNFTYDIRTGKIISMYDLISKRFEKSGYKAEQDQKRLIGIAEKGGFRNYGYYEGAQNIANLELDTPTIQIVRMWYSTDPMGPGEELYVPALVFPIKNWEKSNYWNKNVIVPIVKNILDTEEKNNPPMPFPMPMPIEDGPAIKPAEDVSVSN